MKNKRGILLAEETLKMVISVIIIIFLTYFLISLYFSKINDRKAEEAEAVLERINTIILGLEDGTSEFYKIPNPRGWGVFSFVPGQGEEIPNSCNGRGCVCICDKSLIGSQAKECFKDGRCLEIEGLLSFGEIEINNPDEGLTSILIKKEGELISLEKE